MKCTVEEYLGPKNAFFFKKKTHSAQSIKVRIDIFIR